MALYDEIIEAIYTSSQSGKACTAWAENMPHLDDVETILNGTPAVSARIEQKNEGIQISGEWMGNDMAWGITKGSDFLVMVKQQSFEGLW